MMFPFIAHAEPAMPCQVNGQRREIKHHPAEDAGDQLRIFKQFVLGKMRVCARWIGQCRERDTGCN